MSIKNWFMRGKPKEAPPKAPPSVPSRSVANSDSSDSGPSGIINPEEFILVDKSGAMDIDRIVHLAKSEVPARKKGRLSTIKYEVHLSPLQYTKVVGRILEKGTVHAPISLKEGEYWPRHMLLEDMATVDNMEDRQMLDEKKFMDLSADKRVPIRVILHPGPRNYGLSIHPTEVVWKEPGQKDPPLNAPTYHLNVELDSHRVDTKGDIVLTVQNGVPVARLPDGSYLIPMDEMRKDLAGGIHVVKLWKRLTLKRLEEMNYRLGKDCLMKAEEAKKIKNLEIALELKQDELDNLREEMDVLEKENEKLAKEYGTGSLKSHFAQRMQVNGDNESQRGVDSEPFNGAGHELPAICSTCSIGCSIYHQ